MDIYPRYSVFLQGLPFSISMPAVAPENKIIAPIDIIDINPPVYPPGMSILENIHLCRNHSGILMYKL